MAAKENVSRKRGFEQRGQGHGDVETATGLSRKGSLLTSQRARLKRCWRPKSGYR